jgi:hypothetical protein
VNAETIKAASDAVKPLLDKLGNLGLQGFELAVRQQYVHAASTAVVLVALFAALLVSLRLHNGAWARKKADRPDADWFYWADVEGGGWVLAVSVSAAALLLGLIFCLEPTIGRVINPHWYALKEIIDLLPR